MADERAHKLEELAGLVLEMARPELAPLIVVELYGHAHRVEVGRVRVAAEVELGVLPHLGKGREDGAVMSTCMRARLKVELGVLPDIVQPKLALDRVCRRLDDP